MGPLCQVVGSPSNGRESDPQNMSLSASHVLPPFSILTHKPGKCVPARGNAPAPGNPCAGFVTLLNCRHLRPRSVVSLTSYYR